MKSKLALLLLAITLAGCATVFASGPDQIPVMTNPPGAYVYVNGQVVGQTPTMVALERSAPAQIQIYLPGFQPVVMAKYKSLNGWFIANILFFPLAIVDLVTGDWQRYDTSGIAIGLTPAQGPPPQWYQPPPDQQQQIPPPPGPGVIQPGGGPATPPPPPSR